MRQVFREGNTATFRVLPLINEAIKMAAIVILSGNAKYLTVF